MKITRMSGRAVVCGMAAMLTVPASFSQQTGSSQHADAAALTQAATPMFSPAPGYYSVAQTVSITDTTPGAAIYYTLDGSSPTTASTPYSQPITVSVTQTVKAAAVATGYSISAVESGLYRIIPRAATPVISPAAGSYSSAVNVSINDTTTNATIYYTTDNSLPTTASTPYTQPLVIDSTQTVRAAAVATGYTKSSVAVAQYRIASGALSLTPTAAALTVGQSQQYTAAVPGGRSVVWTVDAVVGGNAQVGVISAAGLYTAGTAPGTHAIVATTTGESASSGSANAVVTDLAGVYTYHNDLARDGTNNQEYALNTSNVTAASFGKRASCATDGAIYAQPLWVANLSVNGSKHNVVFVATQHDSLYAFDADASACVKLWQVSLVDIAHGGQSGETSVPGNLVGSGFGDIEPEVGVTGTPVIDPTTGILYVVSKSINSAQTMYYHRLHAIDIATGNEKSGSPIAITGSYPGTGDGGTTVLFNPRQENQRAGLALVNGVVYIAFTAHEDKAPWYGWMMSYKYGGASLTQQSVLNVAPNVQQGGIWMSGGAPSVDSLDNIYVLTGNGQFNAANTSAPNNDYGDSLLQLNSKLQVNHYFTPSDQLGDYQNDLDFGSGGSSVLADLPAGNTVVHALICAGKDGGMFVLNRDMIGGFGDAVAVQKINVGKAVFATGAVWNNSLFIAGVGGPMNRYSLNTKKAQYTLASKSSHVFGFAGVTPSISAQALSNGIVWGLDTGQYCTPQSNGCGPVVLYAYDATNLATPLWSSAGSTADTAGFAIKFTVPTVANGRVYVGTRGNNTGHADNSTSTPGELEIYGLQ